jgi:hypothetical protein
MDRNGQGRSSVSGALCTRSGDSVLARCAGEKKNDHEAND